jgi:hypothetical protein
MESKFLKELLELVKHNYNETLKQKPKNTGKCYTCKPRGTLKDHIISQTEHFTFNHDLFRRPVVIITSKAHYHDIDQIPENIKLALFEDIHSFINFWNLNNKYQIVINNGELATNNHFHAKLTLDPTIINRMRRDHFTRINLQKTYNETN